MSRRCIASKTLSMSSLEAGGLPEPCCAETVIDVARIQQIASVAGKRRIACLLKFQLRAGEKGKSRTIYALVVHRAFHLRAMIQKPMAVLTHQATTVHLKETAKPRRLSSLALQICDSSKTWSVMFRSICSGPAEDM